MSAEPSDDYARLPADLLARILDEAPAVADRVRFLLAPAIEQQGRLRQAALDHDLIRYTHDTQPSTVCAVDGGFAVERTIAVDIVMAVAVGVEGFEPTGRAPAWSDNQYETFHDVMVHNLDNERLARAAAIVHELAILADAPHGVRIYDGSHLTPVIQFNSGVSSLYDPVNQAVVDLGRAVGIVESFEAFCGNPAIVGMPKYDSSREITKKLSELLGSEIPGDDRYVTSLVLRGGEYTTPERVPADPWAMLHFSAAPDTYASHSRIVELLEAAISPLRTRQLYFTYWRPTDESPAYRLEIKPAVADDEDALNVVFATLAAQIVSPFVREPFPQYLADVMAKSVSLGLQALQAAAQLRLTRDQPQLAQQLVHSYRTEGK